MVWIYVCVFTSIGVVWGWRFRAHLFVGIVIDFSKSRDGAVRGSSSFHRTQDFGRVQRIAFLIG